MKKLDKIQNPLLVCEPSTQLSATVNQLLILRPNKKQETQQPESPIKQQQQTTIKQQQQTPIKQPQAVVDLTDSPMSPVRPKWYCDLCEKQLASYQSLYNHKRTSKQHESKQKKLDEQKILFKIDDNSIKAKDYDDLLSKTEWLSDSVTYLILISALLNISIIIIGYQWIFKRIEVTKHDYFTILGYIQASK